MPTKKYPAKSRLENHLMAKNADLLWRIQQAPPPVETETIAAKQFPATAAAADAGSRRARVIVWLFAKFA